MISFLSRIFPFLLRLRSVFSSSPCIRLRIYRHVLSTIYRIRIIVFNPPLLQSPPSDLRSNSVFRMKVKIFCLHQGSRDSQSGKCGSCALRRCSVRTPGTVLAMRCLSSRRWSPNDALSPLFLCVCELAGISEREGLVSSTLFRVLRPPWYIVYV